jgi:hypothetical protein
MQYIPGTSKSHARLTHLRRGVSDDQPIVHTIEGDSERRAFRFEATAAFAGRPFFYRFRDLPMPGNWSARQNITCAFSACCCQTAWVEHVIDNLLQERCRGELVNTSFPSGVTRTVSLKPAPPSPTWRRAGTTCTTMPGSN